VTLVAYFGAETPNHANAGAETPNHGNFGGQRRIMENSPRSFVYHRLRSGANQLMYDDSLGLLAETFHAARALLVSGALGVFFSVVGC
jgi:hypothetical protein